MRLTVSACLPTSASFPDFVSTSGLALNGTAEAVNTADGGVIRLVPAFPGQSGSVYTTTVRNVSRFSTTFNFRLTNPGGGADDFGSVGADGVMFVMQRAGNTALGEGGGGLGYLGVAPSVAVEFDTWSNEWDPSSNHIGINVNGSVQSVQTIDVSPDFDDGTLKTAWIDYDGVTLEVSVTPAGQQRPGVAQLSMPIDIPVIIGAPTAYIGFSGATGQVYENVDVVSWSYESTCVPTVLANDTDADGNPLTAILVSPPSNGSVALSADGTFTYSPTTNFFGADSFTYKANDGFTDSNVATVTMTVNPVNDSPSFVAGPNQTVPGNGETVTVPGWATAISAGPANESGQTVSFLVINDTDFLFATQPTVDVTGTLTFAPSGAQGTAVVTVRAHDNGGTANGGIDTSAPQTFTITVLTGNHSPTAVDDSATATTGVDTLIAVLANDSDPDGDALHIVSVGDASNGSATVNQDGFVIYRSAGGFDGLDSFTYTIADSHGATSTATVFVTVLASCTPEPSDLVAWLPGNGNGNDLVGGIAGQLVGGTTFAAGKVRQAFSFDGVDSYVSVPDSNALHLTGSMTLAAWVKPTGANDDTHGIISKPRDAGGTGWALRVEAGQADFGFNDGLVNCSARSEATTLPIGEWTHVAASYELDPNTQLGTVRLYLNGQLTLTDSSCAFGSPDVSAQPLQIGREFENGIIGGRYFTGLVDEAMVFSRALPASDIQSIYGAGSAGICEHEPVATDDSVTTNMNTPVTIAVLANDSDADGQPLHVTDWTSPSHGSVVRLDDNRFTYTPAPSYYGPDSFRYFIADTRGGTAMATVRITVNFVSQPLVITTTALPDASAPDYYTGGCLTATGGIGPRHWLVASGLPAGVSLLDNGCFAGQVLETGSFQFTAQVTDNIQTAQHTYVIRGGVAEQAQWPIDNLAPTIAFGGQYQVSQTFRTAMDGDLLSVGLPLYCNDGGVHMEIRGVTGGLANGTVIMSQDIAAASVQTFAPFLPYHRLYRFDSPVFQSKNTDLAIVLTSTGSCFLYQTVANTSYPFGDGATGTGGFWMPLSGIDPTRPDVPFEVVIDDGRRLLFETTGRSQGTATLLTAGPHAGTVLLAGGNTNIVTLFNPTDNAIPSDNPLDAVPPHRFVDRASLSTFRRDHTATLLPDGWVLVVGGSDQAGQALASAELYNPATGVWSTVGSLSTARFRHTATLISGGRVLIAGGEDNFYLPKFTSTEIFVYDSVSHTGSFVAGPEMSAGRADHTATLLIDGRVLVAGGWNTSLQGYDAELYTPDSGVGSFAATGAMQQRRVGHGAALLTCPPSTSCAWGGQVLIAGGVKFDNTGPALDAEVFDPLTGAFTSVGRMSTERTGPSAVTLNSGQVLIAGGGTQSGTQIGTTEVYDPETGQFGPGSDLAIPRAGVASVHLADDSVLLVGGYGSSNSTWQSAQLFKPADNIAPQGAVNETYSTSIVGIGPGPLTFTVKSGSLPAGVLLATQTGAISGTPTAAGVTSRVLVDIADAAGHHTWRDVAIQVNGPLSISIAPFADAVTNQPYTTRILAAGGSSGRTWTVVSGSLPPGLTLGTDGVINGTASTPGSYTFTVQVADHQGHVDQRAITIIVDPPWTSTFPDGGIVNPGGLFVDPAHAGRVYAALQWRGLHRSDNQGLTWTNLTDAVQNLWPLDRTGLTNFTIGPDGAFYATSYGSGPYKSTTGGVSWTQISTGITGGVQSFAVNRANNHLYAGTYGQGFFRSDNNGSTWTSLGSGMQSGASIVSIGVEPGSTHSIYAGTQTNGMYKSVDEGATWFPANNGSPLVEVRAIGVNASSTNIVYAVGRDTAGNTVAVRSTDSGFNWITLSGTLYGYWQPGAELLTIDSATDTLYVGSQTNVMKWTAGGTGAASSFVAASQVTAVGLDATLGTLYAGTNGFGIFRSLTGGATWAPASSGLRGINFPHSSSHSINVDETNSQFVYAGSINGGYRSVNGGATWTPMNYPDSQASTLLTHPFEPHAVYGFQNTLRKSIDNGQTWQNLTPTMCCWNDGDVVLDHGNPLKMYMAIAGSPAAPDGIYKSTDGGTTWTRMNNGLPTPASFHTLAIDPQDGNIVFAGTQGAGRGGPFTSAPGIYRTLDGGATWTRLQGGLPDQLNPNQIAIHPQSPNIIFMGSETVNGGVYKSTDGGTSWTKLLTENVNTVVVDPSDANIVYAGTWNTNGFYRSQDGGATWTTFSAGLPIHAGLESIALDPHNPRHLFLATTAGAYQLTFIPRDSVVDLDVTMIDSPDPVTAGSPLTYSIQVSNIGSAAATGVTVTGGLPAGTTFYSASSGGVPTGGGTVTWPVGTLAPGQGQSLTLVVVPWTGGELQNTASASSNETDGAMANNSATATTTVLGGTAAVMTIDQPVPFVSQFISGFSLPVNDTCTLSMGGVQVGGSLSTGPSGFFFSTFDTVSVPAGFPRSVALNCTGAGAFTGTQLSDGSAVALSPSGTLNFSTPSTGFNAVLHGSGFPASCSSSLSYVNTTLATPIFTSISTITTSADGMFTITAFFPAAAQNSPTYLWKGITGSCSSIGLSGQNPGGTYSRVVTFNEAGAGVLPHATSALSFGLEAVGGSRTLSVAISNAGAGLLITQNSTAISGANAAEFHLLSLCSSTPIPSGQSCNLQVSFGPQFAGSKSAVLDVTFNGGAPPLHVQLTGTGIVANDRLVGRVTDRQTGQPLSNIMVNAYNASGAQVTATVTDVDGTYATVPLPAGGYYAKAIGAPDRVNLLYKDISCALGCNVTTGHQHQPADRDYDDEYRLLALQARQHRGHDHSRQHIGARRRHRQVVQHRWEPGEGCGHRRFGELPVPEPRSGKLSRRNAQHVRIYRQSIRQHLVRARLQHPDARADHRGRSRNVHSRGHGIAGHCEFRAVAQYAGWCQCGRRAETRGFLAPVTATFFGVTAAGRTTMLASSTGAPLPVGFSAGSPARFYDVQTTASFNVGATVCVNYSGTAFLNLSGVRLLHQQNGSWSDVTSSLNQVSRTVCGVAETLGSFTVAETASTTLTAQSCALEPAFHSIEGTTPVTVQFTNNHPDPTNVYWLDYNGQRVIYATLPPGGSYVQSTYLTHPWLISDQSSECRGIYLPLPFAAEAVIQ